MELYGSVNEVKGLCFVVRGYSSIGKSNQKILVFYLPLHEYKVHLPPFFTILEFVADDLVLAEPIDAKYYHC